MSDERTKGLHFEEAHSLDNIPAGSGYILAIGIDAYEHFPQLNNAVRDARAIVEVLTQKYQFEPSHVRTLFNEQATEKQLLREMKRLASEVKPTDNLIIYFSGHGHFDPILKEGYWIPVDAEHDHTGDYISNATLLTYLRAIPARHTFLVADSCFSGSLLAETRSVAADRLDALPSRWGLTSGRNEVVLDGPSGSHSPFATALLEFLGHNQDEKVRISRLIHHVEEVTSNNSEQTPMGNRIRNVGDRGGELILRMKSGSNFVPPINTPPVRKQPKKPISTPPKQQKIEVSSSKFPKWLIPVIVVAIVGVVLIGFMYQRSQPGTKNPGKIAIERVPATTTTPEAQPTTRTPIKSTVLEALNKRAKSGDKTAYREIANLYIKGDGVEVNYRAAAAYLKKGVDLGDDEAMFLLGNLYLKGNDGVPKDLDMGKKLLAQSAKLGNKNARRYLLRMGIR